MMTELEGHAYPALLRLAVTTAGLAFIWPIRLAGADGILNEWWRTEHLAAAEAEKLWVSLRANKTAGHYEIYTAANQGRPPPAWPEEPFDQIVKAGFRDHLITSTDHPIIKRLRGEI
jgi:hypothetical protein